MRDREGKAQNHRANTIIPRRRHLIFPGLDLGSFDFQRGFTMVEVVVMTAIIVVISAMVLGGFTGFNERAALSRSAKELALSLREAQNMALAVKRVRVGTGFRVPRAFGVLISTGTPGRYFLFADVDGDQQFNQSVDAKIGQDIIFNRNIAITSLKDQNGVSHNTVHVVFFSPEATPVLSKENGASIGETLTVTLATPSGNLIRRITIRTSGQITIIR